MSAVIPFPHARTRPPRDGAAAYIAQAGKPKPAREAFLEATVRGHCQVRHYSDAVMGRAVLGAKTQLANGQSREFAITYGCDLADRLHANEVDAAWGEDTR
jgi:hypothetical protein